MTKTDSSMVCTFFCYSYPELRLSLCQVFHRIFRVIVKRSLVLLSAPSARDSRNFPTLYTRCEAQALSECGHFHLSDWLKVRKGCAVRYLLFVLIVLSCGCSKTEITNTHKQEDYEWKDSVAVVKTKFPGQLAEQKKEEAVNYLVGTTEVDGLPYGVTFVFLKN